MPAEVFGVKASFQSYSFRPATGVAFCMRIYPMVVRTAPFILLRGKNYYYHYYYYYYYYYYY